MPDGVALLPGLSFGTFLACLGQNRWNQLWRSKMASPGNEIIISDTVWWIRRRGQSWGPFEYQWSSDLRGVEFLLRGEKFGEVCSQEEFFADLAPFGLPISVCRVAAIIAGSVAVSLAAVEEPDIRVSRLIETLDEFGLGRYIVRQVAEARDSHHGREML